ncbi:hypothetical protein LMC05_10155 [Limosilactobacillus reuteri]|uniref:hypothetical protein n=1 Tax=Limosilactobacillus reuteri TaxID=1598 RepID=UPI001E611B03|nr:hypothetical protein [Limosilactobacillus reuteri]MCC4509355.1 hypothetical protein [Limosilactobacillus reuteri]
MSTSQFEQLTRTVVASSESDDWMSAKDEWTVIGMEEDSTQSEACICGQEDLVYLFTIQNQLNGTKLFPIGSRCINQFKNADLNVQVTTYQALWRLIKAVNAKEYITLDNKFFTRKLLKYLYDNDAFKPNEHNNWDPEQDYKFLLKMFNMRTEPSKKRQAKVKALIMNAVIPFAKKQFSDQQK